MVVCKTIEPEVEVAFNLKPAPSKLFTLKELIVNSLELLPPVNLAILLVSAPKTTSSLASGVDVPIPKFPELSIKVVAAVFEPPPLNCNFPEFEFSPTKVLVPPK